MKHTIKILIFILIFVILTIFFSPSFSKVSIDNIAVVVAMGIDTDYDTQSNIKVSFQFTDASSVSESGLNHLI